VTPKDILRAIAYRVFRWGSLVVGLLVAGAGYTSLVYQFGVAHGELSAGSVRCPPPTLSSSRDAGLGARSRWWWPDAGPEPDAGPRFVTPRGRRPADPYPYLRGPDRVFLPRPDGGRHE